MNWKFWQKNPGMSAGKIMDFLKENYGYEMRNGPGLNIDDKMASYSWAYGQAAGEYVLEPEIRSVTFPRSRLQELAEKASQRGKTGIEMRATYLTFLRAKSGDISMPSKPLEILLSLGIKFEGSEPVLEIEYRPVEHEGRDPNKEDDSRTFSGTGYPG